MQDRIRRSPESWIKSCEMDPTRKILVVEGSNDRYFIEYLLDDAINKNSIILEIESIDVPGEILNGNKGRILFISQTVSSSIVNFKCFLDKDYSPFIGVNFPNCVISTDFKDLESYLYEIEFLNKFLKIGLGTNKIDAKKLLNEIDSLKFFGFVRMTSLLNNLNLSVNATNERLSKYLNIDKSFTNNISENDYLQGLINKSTTKKNANELKQLLENTIKKYGKSSSREVVHGKDVIELIKEIANKLGYKRDNIENVFWMSFDKNKVVDYPNLDTVVKFLK